MSLKNTWLHTALSLWMVCLLPTFFSWLFILCSVRWLVKLQKKGVWASCILMVVTQLRISNSTHRQSPPTNLQATIQEIKSSYAIAEYENQRILLYDVQEASFGDVLQLEVDCSPIDGLKNFRQFSFPEWAGRRGIQYGCSIKHQAIIEKGTSIRAQLYARIQDMEEEPREWLLSTLYGIHDKEREVSYMVSSSGMHMSFVCTLLERFFALWLSTGACQWMTLLLVFGFGNFFLWREALVRILCFRLANLLFAKYSAQDRLGIGMILLLMILPYLAQEITFVLPVAFRLCFLFNVQKRSKRMLSYLVLLPLQFFYFNEVDVIQILLFPLLRIGYGTAFLMAIAYLLVPLSILYWLAMLFYAGLKWLQHFTFPLYYAASFHFLLLWIYYGFCWLGRRTKTSAGMLVTLLLYTQVSPYMKPYMEIMMIDVGQGDCSLISLPFHQGHILIDVAGIRNKNLPKEVIVPVLHSLGIRSLDIVIITHDDFDHSGGLSQLQELMQVDEVITEKQKEVNLKGFTLNFLLSDRRYEDQNDNSILTFLDAYDTRLLFMGDAGKAVEAELMLEYPKLQADILKIGHHGSKTSSSLSFLHQLHPSLGLISCGAHNFYGHPSPETLASLAQEDILALDTPNKGAVSIKLTNFIRFYKTATNEFGIIKPGE